MMTSSANLLCLLLIVGSATAQSYENLDIYKLQEKLGVLESNINQIFAVQSDVATVSAGSQDRLNLIQDRLIKEIMAHNEQQELLFATLREQIDDLQDETDQTSAAVAATAELVSQTTTFIAEQEADIYAIASDNQEQQAYLDKLRQRIREVRQQLGSDLDAATQRLDQEKAKVDISVAQLAQFIDDRKCEYGTASIPPGEYFVPFKVAFNEVPTLAVTLAGFRADFAVKGYGAQAYDSLALDKHVKEITKEGFTVSAFDASDGMVEVDTIYCVYMVCQNLDRDVDIHLY